MIYSVQRGTGLISHRYQVVGINLLLLNIFTYFADWGMNEPDTVFMPLCRGKVTKKTLCYHWVLIWVKCQSMQFWVLFFCLFPLGAIKPAGRTFWDFPALLWRLMVTLSSALCLQALESEAFSPELCFRGFLCYCFSRQSLRWYQRWPSLLKFYFSCSWNSGCWWF